MFSLVTKLNLLVIDSKWVEESETCVTYMRNLQQFSLVNTKLNMKLLAVVQCQLQYVNKRVKVI